MFSNKTLLSVSLMENTELLLDYKVPVFQAL